MSKQKGITLIALVITIIVLLILAAVSIATLTGENGILNQADKAGEETKDKNEEDKLKLAIMDSLTHGTGTIIDEKLRKAIDNQFGMNASDNLSGIGPWIYEGERKIYQIDENGSVSEKELQEVASISKTEITIDGSYLLTSKLNNGKEAGMGDVKWTSDNLDVATVNSNGIVMCGTKTTEEGGTATITCTGANGTSVQCAVTSTAKIVFTNNGSLAVKVNGKKEEESESGKDKNPVIPVGYSAIDTKTASWNLDENITEQPNVDEGLAIMDKRGNIFIWVPVPLVIDNNFGDKSKKVTVGVDDTPFAMLKEDGINYVGITYTFSDWAGVTGSASGLDAKWEPVVDVKHESEIFSEGILQSDYNEMVKRVSKYNRILCWKIRIWL